MAESSRISKLSQRMTTLSDLQVDQIERMVSDLELLNTNVVPVLPMLNFDWPHAPLHRLDGNEVFMVTGGTLYKQHFFNSAWALDLMQSVMFRLAKEYGWELEAWACFSNHYHFIARQEQVSQGLAVLINQLHSQTAIELNRHQAEEGRTVWYNFYDTRLTFQNSYLARLNYVHQNPVHHRLVPVANQYKWCSAAWFERTATRAQIKTVYSFKTDKVRVKDDYEVWQEGCDVTY